MIISVKRKHIKAGKPSDPCNCAVALAVKDAGFTMDQTNNDFMGVDQIAIDTVQGRFRTTTRVEKFIRAFDSGKKVKPFNFRLIPDE